MKEFAFKHSPGRIDGLRVIANIGQKGSVQKLPETVPASRTYRWLGAASIVASGSVSMKFPDGAQFTMNRGDFLPSIVRQSGDIVQEALEDNTLVYCFQSLTQAPMWNRGYVLNPGIPLELPARKLGARCILVSGRARCNDVADLNAESAPHIVRVSPEKPLTILGDGVLLYMFEPAYTWDADPAEDDDPLLDDYIKGLVLRRV